MNNQVDWQVTNQKISKKLEKLGVKQESLWWWIKTRVRSNNTTWKDEWIIADKCNYIDPNSNLDTCIEHYSAFTVAELGKLLPDYYETSHNRAYWLCKPNSVDFYEIADTEADARGLMLIYLIENNLIKIGEIKCKK